ncbi:hypothetical protein AWZ03_004578 [Drosophila navojoa]|uniref:Uncharacterized protein n=1 Tax=Drosophila navojoa TaxID=7232 RepID=A0A484BJY4_DRONA|nr:hypothetical protein AWZ03_004578 [Drosophila navojoa]
MSCVPRPSPATDNRLTGSDSRHTAVALATSCKLVQRLAVSCERDKLEINRIVIIFVVVAAVATATAAAGRESNRHGRRRRRRLRLELQLEQELEQELVLEQQQLSSQHFIIFTINMQLLNEKDSEQQQQLLFAQSSDKLIALRDRQTLEQHADDGVCIGLQGNGPRTHGQPEPDKLDLDLDSNDSLQLGN